MDELEPHPTSGLFEVYVSGIPADMSELEVKKRFSQAGKVAKYTAVRRDDSCPHYFGFIGYQKKEEALNAIKTIDGYMHPATGVQMKVKAAIQKNHQKQHGTPNARGSTAPNARFPSQRELTGAGSADSTPPVQAALSSCAVCNKAGIQQCAQCKTVRYCSRDCQVKHWADHQKSCLSVVKGSSPKALTTSPAVKVASPDRPIGTSPSASPTTATEKLLNKLSSPNFPGPKEGTGAKPPRAHSQPPKVPNNIHTAGSGSINESGTKPTGKTKPVKHQSPKSTKTLRKRNRKRNRKRLRKRQSSGKQPDLAERLNGPMQRQNDRNHMDRPSRGQGDRRNDGRGYQSGYDSSRAGARGQGRENNSEPRGPRSRSNEQRGPGGRGQGLRRNDEPTQGHQPRSNDHTRGPRSRSNEQRGPGGRGNDSNRGQPSISKSDSGNETKPVQQEKHSLQTMGDTLKKEQKMMVQVMDVESPSQFWVQLVDEQVSGQLLSQQEQLFTHYQNKANLIKTMPNREPLVAALFPDDSMWYRAEVLRHKPDKFQVRYVDYGNKSVVDSIYSLERKFYELPVMSINCGISGICSTSKPWSEAANEFFKQQLGNGLCKAMVVESTQGVVLLDLLTPDGSQVSRLMVDAKHAESCSAPAASASATSASANSASSPSASANSASAPLRPNIAASAGPRVIMAADLERSTLSPSPAVVMVMVSDAASPSDIIIQTTTHMAAIEEMKVEITKQQSNYTGQYTPQKVGELVLAKFSLDNEWYRAEVLNMDNKNQIHVLFVDYGNKEVVGPAQIASLSAGKLSQLPVYGIRCSLDGVGKVAPGKSWDPQVLEPCMAIFNAVVKKLCAQTLLVEFTKQGSAVSVNKQLLDGGLVMPVSTVTVMADLPTLDVPLTPTLVDCSVVVANSPTDICLHVHTDKVTQAFGGINAILASASLTPGYVPQQGEVVCGFFENVWNRAEVVEIKNNKCTLRYIDYGNIDEIGPEGVARLAAGLGALPPVAVVCRLSGAGPSAVLKPNALSAEELYKAKLTKRDLGYELVIVDAQGAALNPGLIMTKPNSASKSDLPAMTPIPLQIQLQNLVLQVNSLTDFYVMDSQAAMEGVVTAMGTLPAQLPSQVPESPGQLVCCYIEGEWYRMCIEQITADEVSVQSVDYGFIQVVSRDSVKEIPEVLLSFPPVARRCALADLNTPGEAAAVMQFKEMVENRTVTLIAIETRTESTLVKICDEAAGTFLNTKFINLVAPLIDLEPVSTAAPTQTVMSPVQGLAKADMPQQFSGVVVFSIHPQQFYVQNTADGAQLMDILTKVATHVAQVPPTEGFNPATGDLCLGQNDDQAWYRCRITEASSQGFEVNFIDFGDSAVLPIVRLRPMPQELLLYPALAYRCCLAGIFPITDGPWAARAVQRFKALTTESDIYTFEKNQSNQSFYLVGMRHGERGDLAQTLVTEGVAARRHMEAATAAPAAMSDGEVSAVEEENTRLKEENEILRKQFERMKLMLQK